MYQGACIAEWFKILTAMLSGPARFVLSRSAACAGRNISVCPVQFLPRGSRKPINEANQSKSELETIAQIESDLFDASSHKSVVTSSPEPTPRKMNEYWRVEVNPFTKSKRKEEKAKQSCVPSVMKVDPDLGLSYQKLSLNDPVLSKLMLTAKSRKARNKKGQIVVEGRRLILEAISAGAVLETVLFANKACLLEIKEQLRCYEGVKVFRVPQQDLRSWSTLVTCPGVIAIFRKPSQKDIEKAAAARETFPITVICDNIREPNNLGSIIRSCAALPVREMLITKGCCDPWDTKALRGGCGAQFHVALYEDLTWEQIDTRLLGPQANLTGYVPPLVYLAESNTANCEKFDVEVVPYDEMHIDEKIRKCVLVIGGETHGISEDAYRLLKTCNKSTSGGCVHIPMAKNVESLNTASAVTLLLYEMRRNWLKLMTQRKQVEDVLN